VNTRHQSLAERVAEVAFRCLIAAFAR